MNKKYITCAVLSAALIASSIASAPAVLANSLYDSPLYPTPKGAELTPASYNESVPDWSLFDSLINMSHTEQSTEKRMELLHQAEDLLMETGAILPLAYSCDSYMQSPDVDGIYCDPFGAKYFQFAVSPGNDLRINIGDEPQTLDPALASSATDITMIANLFSGLFMYEEDGRIIPVLADDDNPYEVSEDGTLYTFHLKKDLKWSDGSPITAADFEYSWKRAADPDTGAPYSYTFDGLFNYIDGELDVTAADELTLTARLASPCPYFVSYLANVLFYPVNKAAVEAADIYGNNPSAWTLEAGFVTSGAYTVDTWRHSDAMIMKKNPNWIMADRVNNNTIECMLNNDGVAVFAAYSAGNIDFADNVPTNEISALKEREDFHICSLPGTKYLSFNINGRLFKDKTMEEDVNIRKAISLLIDRDYIADDILQRGEQIATSFVSPSMTDNSGNPFKENSKQYKFPIPEEAGYYPSQQTDDSTDEAIKLLESAGYTFENGKLSAATPLHFVLMTPGGETYRELAEAIQSDLKEIGIDVDIDSREFAVFLAELQKGHFEASIQGWVSDYNDPLGMLELFVSDSGNNYPRFGKE